MSLAAHT